MRYSKKLTKKTFFSILLVFVLISCNKKEILNEEPLDFGMNNIFFNGYSVDGQPLFVPVWAITEDDNGNIWFGGAGIIAKYDGENMKNITEELGIDIGGSIYCVYKDDDNTIWFGTDSGVLRINCNNLNYTIYTKEDGLASNGIRDILKDNQGNYWFASYSTPGLTKFDGTNWTFIDYQSEYIGWVRDILTDDSESLWFAAMNLGLYELKDTAWSLHDIGATARSIINYNGEIIVGTLGEGALKFENENWINIVPGLDGVDIGSMIVDHNNNLWFGILDDYDSGYGLAKYNGTSFEKISIKNDVNKDMVFTIFEDSKSRIWVGNSGVTLIKN
jgi:ligand-binding sensor domain-containing protein